MPVLLLQGETDRNVVAEQVHVLASALHEAGNTSVTGQMLPGVDHLLLDNPDGRRSVADLASKRMSATALRVLSDWVAGQLRR